MEKELKESTGYSLDPLVIRWVTQTAAQLTAETGDRVSDSKLVNEILRSAMQEENEKSLKKIMTKVLAK